MGMGGFIGFMISIFLLLVQMSVIFPLPLTDIGTVRYKTLPMVTYLLLLVNGLVFLGLQAPTMIFAESNYDLQAYVNQLYTFGFREIALQQGLGYGAITAFTHMFMHADISHLLGNMVFLWAFGRRIEDACGSWRYLLFYLTAGLVAALGTAALTPTNADLPGVGASGAIAGIMGAYLILFPGAKVNCMWLLGSIIRVPIAAIRGKDLWNWTIPIPAWIILIYFVVDNFLPSLAVMQAETDLQGVNTVAHLAGFLAALLILLFVRKDLLNRYIAGRSL
ncbi:MAG: rhomboid family intramembrane serine protease [Anaerolinea sp.]|nr:rhomboid family intramembrane serine protease [Anaerolinea sp.]